MEFARIAGVFAGASSLPGVVCNLMVVDRLQKRDDQFRCGILIRFCLPLSAITTSGEFVYLVPGFGRGECTDRGANLVNRPVLT